MSGGKNVNYRLRMEFVDKNSVCCAFIEGITHLVSNGLGHNEVIPIKYSPARRLFLLQWCPAYMHRGGQIEKKQFLERIPLHYCTHCGKKLPSELTQSRQQVLKSEYGIDIKYDPASEATIPKEFKTDEWWKKRGL